MRTALFNAPLLSWLSWGWDFFRFAGGFLTYRFAFYRPCQARVCPFTKLVKSRNGLFREEFVLS